MEEEAAKQKETEEKLLRRMESFFSTMTNETKKATESKNEYIDKVKKLEKQELKNNQEKEKLEQELNEANNKLAKFKEEKYINDKVKKWRRNSIIVFAISIVILLTVLFFFYKYDNTLDIIFENKKVSVPIGFFMFFIEFWFGKVIYNRFENHSNIEKYKKNIKIPDNL